MKRFSLLLTILFLSLISFAQTPTDSQRKDIFDQLDNEIKVLSRFSYANPEVIPVYTYQLKTAEGVLRKYSSYNKDPEIFQRWYELSVLISKNKEMVDFMIPRLSTWMVHAAISAFIAKDDTKGLSYLEKAIEMDRLNVMAHYELSKYYLKEKEILKGFNILTKVLTTMNPNEDERNLCNYLLASTHDKYLLKAIALADVERFAHAVEILEELKSYCDSDQLKVCNINLINNVLQRCQNGIYNDHIAVAKRAQQIGRYDVAGDFAENTYEYLARNRSGISDTTDLESLTRAVVSFYLSQLQDKKGAKNEEYRHDLVRKIKTLSQMIGGTFESESLKNIASITGTTIDRTEQKLDSIEQSLPPQGYTVDYQQYIQDTISDPQEGIKKIENDYLKSEQNQQPPQSVAIQSTQTKTLRKEIDDKFYETRTFLTVNNYEKALEVLESANMLAKIDAEKEQVETMYRTAIREITARRMSAAEYALFQGDVQKSDSLVGLTNELLTRYKMGEDSAIVLIMNSYLRALDRKVCEKKQDEINTFIFNILDFIRKNDYNTAEAYISRAMQVKGSSECRLDKSRVRKLKKQIAKPIEYVAYKNQIFLDLENTNDTVKFIRDYAHLEQFYYDNELWDMEVNHSSLRSFLENSNNDQLILSSIETFVRQKQYFIALEALGALKDMGYTSSQTKKIQIRIGKFMSLEMYKRSVKIEESLLLSQKYANDKWFKHFNKSYKKYLIQWNKSNGKSSSPNIFVKFKRAIFG